MLYVQEDLEQHVVRYPVGSVDVTHSHERADGERSDNVDPYFGKRVFATLFPVNQDGASADFKTFSANRLGSGYFTFPAR